MNPQSVALLRWLIRRCGRWTVRFIVVAVVGCVAIAWLRISGEVTGQWKRESGLGFLLEPGIYAMLLLPLGIRLASIDWSDLQVERPGPGIDPFLLRQPVSARRLATILALFRLGTLWLVVFIGLMVAGVSPWVAAWASGLTTLQIVGIGLSMTSIVWRPFHLGGLRIITLATTLVAMCLTALVPAFEEPRLRPFAMTLAVTIPTLTMTLGWVLSVQSAVAARGGLGPATAITRLWWSATGRGDRFWDPRTRRPALPRVDFGSVREALRWYDQRSLSQPRRLLFWWMALPVGLSFSVLQPQPVGWVFASVLLSAYLMSTTRAHYAGVAASPRPGGGLTPLLLAASPLAAVDLVEAKRAVLFRRTLVAVAMTSLWIAVVLTISHAQGGSDWWAWTGQFAGSLTPAHRLATGLAATAAIGLWLAAWIYGRAASTQWLVSLGRDSVTVAAIAAWAVPLGVALTLFLTWFLRQRDWSAVQATALQAARWAPECFVAAILAKVVAVAIGWRWAAAGDPCGSRWRRRVTLRWLAAVGLLTAATLAMLPAVWIDQLGWSMALQRRSIWPPVALLGGYALMLPLARVLILPAVMRRDLHQP